MRMLMFHRGEQSGGFRSVLEHWAHAWPQLEIRTVDLHREVLGSAAAKLLALPRALSRGGLGVLRGRGALTNALNRSHWLSRRLSERARFVQSREAADLSFSFGTTFDASWGGRPHFIYTDLTILANLYYPGEEHAVRPWVQWLPDEHVALQRASLVFGKSEMVSRSVREQYGLPPGKAVCVRAGSNVPAPAQLDPRRFERRNILFVGVDWERKGGPELIEAFRRLRRRYADATLTVVGCDPPVREPGVEIVGWLPREGVARRLAEATVFCMPSRREPFGYVYLEAMQASLPVVAARRGAAPEFVRDGFNGFTVEPDNCAGLTACLEQLLSDPALCREMGERGRHLVETEYNWARTCSDMTRAIQAVLARSQAPAWCGNGPSAVRDSGRVLTPLSG
jgi:glycosyltransferase involved in cell wall biosynthesis